MQAFEGLSKRGQLRRLGRLAHKALRQYPLSQPRLRALRHEHNTTFRVFTDDGQSCVLRVHRPGQHTPEAIQSELLWLTALHHDTELDIPRPLRTKDDALFTVAEVEGVPEARTCALFNWQPGRFSYHRLTPAHLEQIGMFTACLHEHTTRWSFPPHFVRGRVDNLTAEVRRKSLLNPQTASSNDLMQHPTDEDIERALRLVTEQCSVEDAAVVRRAIGHIRETLLELGYTPEVFGLVHADLHYENFLFHRGRAHVIDFDDCGFGHHLFDLNVTLLEIQDHPRYAALRAALLAGYRRARPLSTAHEACLDTFFMLRHLQLLTWILESRDHPAFRDEWQKWTQDELQGIKRGLEGR
jgi:Ser/Thr protein kinase RdoA (MazF antagonist)